MVSLQTGICVTSAVPTNNSTAGHPPVPCPVFRRARILRSESRQCLSAPEVPGEAVIALSEPHSLFLTTFDPLGSPDLPVRVPRTPATRRGAYFVLGKIDAIDAIGAAEIYDTLRIYGATGVWRATGG